MPSQYEQLRQLRKEVAQLWKELEQLKQRHIMDNDWLTDRVKKLERLVTALQRSA